MVAGERRLTYAEVNERANQVAHHLRARGVGRETIVGVALERRPEMVIALLGVWKAGGAYVPLDPAYPAARLSFMLADSCARVLLSDASGAARCSASDVPAVRLDADWPLIERQPRTSPPDATSPDQLAYVMYTSGSTGTPKGVMVLHRGLTNYLRWAVQAYGVGPDTWSPLHTSISFDLTVTSLFPALLAGGTVELLADAPGAQRLAEALRRPRGHSLVKITPAHLELLAQQLSSDDARRAAATFVIGGENLRAESLRFWRAHAPASRLINEYGPTETVVGCCVHEVGPRDPQQGSVPIGRPIANTQLYVLDDGLEPLPKHTAGELFIGGAGVARGYWNRRDATAERFVPDPFAGRAGALMFRTGDLVRRGDDGALEFLGRLDDQVKIRGYRVEIAEVEGALAAHEAVNTCLVVAREDAEGNKQLVGYVVPRAGQSPAPEVLQQFLRERLPEYMVPAHFVSMSAFPLTENGKVDRKALPPPAPRRLVSAAAAGTDTEAALASLWGELLSLENIRPDDNFFELGGHSLLALQAVSRMRGRFGVDVQLRHLVEHRTLAGLAAAVDRLVWIETPGTPRAESADRQEVEL